jgi:3-isopropylmalate/(R)-2-methylmalate dehydratase small subunit
MDRITAFTSRVVPMPMINIDTDQIIPAQFVSSRTHEEFAHALFRNRKDREPDFVLNDPAMQGRSIILAGANFGCGSSREAAPWALVAGGIRAVLSTGFGDIFTNNSLKNGLLPLVLTEDEHQAFTSAHQQDDAVAVTVDLPAGRVTSTSAGQNGPSAPIRIDPFYRQLLVDGMDELDYLLSHVDEIAAYEAGPRLHPTSRARLNAGTPST